MSDPGSDAELFSAWASGDKQAGARLFRRHFAAVHRFFFNKLGGASEVEDLVQQTMVSCVAARDRFRADASFKTFLLAIARNLLLKHLRDRKAIASLDTASVSLADCGLGMSTALELRGDQQRLLTALRHISIDAQLVLELYYWEQFSAKQIAEALETSEAAIRGRLRKAKLELQATLDGLVRAGAGSGASPTLEDLDAWAAEVRERLARGTA